MNREDVMDSSLSCSLPFEQHERILLGHGGGGRLTQKLLHEKIQRVYGTQPVILHDAAVLADPGARLAMSTDSYVIQPLFFPGGDIGSLAVHGTVNDLAMAGAEPRYLSLGFILEEGLPMVTLDRILDSIVKAADACGLAIVTGDTKVVERGKGDGLFINTTGLGVLTGEHVINPGRIQAGDAIVLSGDIGRHGVVVMNARQSGEGWQMDVASDCAPLHREVQDLLRQGLDIHCLRDLTRGGLAAALHELARDSSCSAVIDEESLPVHRQVAAYCELLGLEAYHMANEGRFLCVLPAHEADDAVKILRNFPGSREACIIGGFDETLRSPVRLRSAWGTERHLILFSGEQLPRIC
jgi:hydrogenase expression/formation protein HypE